MTDLKNYQFVKGNRPILISMPHNGFEIPEEINENFKDYALKSMDTDWYLDRLYQFAVEQGCYLISPRYSRYVVDLNRPKSNQNLYPGQDTTELCPTTQFDRRPIYKEGYQLDSNEVDRRIELYWQPYHSKLAESLHEIKERWGNALLFEAHSIKSQVPRFFEGKLLDLNFGDFNHQSCSKELTTMVDSWSSNGYSKVINGRFKGGYITREYGQPDINIHAIQLELSQATYLEEGSLAYSEPKAKEITVVLEEMFKVFYQFIERNVR